MCISRLPWKRSQENASFSEIRTYAVPQFPCCFPVPSFGLVPPVFFIPGCLSLSLHTIPHYPRLNLNTLNNYLLGSPSFVNFNSSSFIDYLSICPSLFYFLLFVTSYPIAASLSSFFFFASFFFFFFFFCSDVPIRLACIVITCFYLHRKLCNFQYTFLMYKTCLPA